MSLDHNTVVSLRVLFAIVFGLVGTAAGFRYLAGFGIAGIGGATVVGGIIGWNAVDFIKGRPHK